MRKRIDFASPSDSIKTASLAQIGSKVVNVIVQLGITMVLARLLTPAEYGTVAVLTAFSSLFSILADAGLLSHSRRIWINLITNNCSF